jgi:hypothetical protein
MDSQLEAAIEAILDTVDEKTSSTYYDAKAKLQALISQEAVRLANLAIGDDEPPIVASTPQGVVRKLLRDEQRQRLQAALTKGGDTDGDSKTHSGGSSDA